MSTLDLWDAVSRTDPKYTKNVKIRHSFTAIKPYYTIRKATEKWGPMGDRWGYKVDKEWVLPPNEHQAKGQLLVQVTLWYPGEGGTTGHVTVYGMNSLDADGVKAAVTDAMTKALSYLGFGGDIFVGEFDNPQYVAALKKEFSATPPPKAPPIDTVFTNAMNAIRSVADKQRLASFAAEIRKRNFSPTQIAALLEAVKTRTIELQTPQEAPDAG